MKGRPFALVGINSDGARDALKTKLEENGITWRNAFDGTTHGPIATRWRVDGWPSMRVIDGDGVIRWNCMVGEGMFDELVKELEKKQAKTGK